MNFFFSFSWKWYKYVKEEAYYSDYYRNNYTFIKINNISYVVPKNIKIKKKKYFLILYLNLLISLPL